MMEFRTALDIPAPYCDLFGHFDCFNKVQSALFNDILHSNKSVVLSAPTGSGKTVAFELAIVRMLLEEKRRSCENTTKEVTELYKSVEFKPKAVYVAPIKALCTEKFNEWEERFNALGISCVKITGDSGITELLAAREAQLIITTPEKWDILTRSALTSEYPELLNDVRLFMVDEVHLLNEDVRGPILEVIMSRMKRIRARLNAFEDTLRFIVASATIPNTEDLAFWIGDDDGAGKGKEISDEAIQLVYMDSQRPVPLRRLVIGVQSKRTGFKFDISLNYKLVDIILKYADGKASLIFCNSRKSTEMAIAVINADRRILPKEKQKKELLIKLSQSLSDVKLSKYIKNGIAFHHAGVSYQDRSLIEENFRNGLIMILLCTNTLAMGVNLPAHLVIIKSTQSYVSGSLREYTESTLLQMIGRAGRPQYDVNCTSVVLTESRNVQKYSNLINGKIPIESHLHKHLTEHLNVEIAYQSIKTMKMALEWIRSTYLYIRLIKNPTEYGLQKDASKETVEKYLEKQCLLHINKLESNDLISKSLTGEINLHATAYGELMATFYISFDTLKMFRKAYEIKSLFGILDLITRCNELSQFTLRTNEKKQLNELNKKVRFPIRKRITTCEEKILCILQAVLGNLEICLPCLSQESSKIIRISIRLANCLVECIRISENQPNSLNLGCYKALLYAVTISKCFHAKLWENSEYVSKQLRKISAVYSSALVNAGKTTLKSISETSAEWFEMILNEPHPFGAEVLENVNSFPVYLIHIDLKPIDQVQIYVKQTNSSYISAGGSGAALIVGDSDKTLLLYIQNIESILEEYGFLDRTLLITNNNAEKIFVHIVHKTLVGVDAHQSIVINESQIQMKNAKGAELISEQLKSNKRKRQRNQIITAKTSGHHQKKVNLHDFIFAKTKISVPNTNDTARKDTLDISDDKISNELSTLHITENDINFDSNTSVKKSLKNATSASNLVQTKLTKFFNLKKHNIIQPKPSINALQAKSINNQNELRILQSPVETNKENINKLKSLEFSKNIDSRYTNRCANVALHRDVVSEIPKYTKAVTQNVKSKVNGLENLKFPKPLNMTTRRDNTLLCKDHTFEKSKHNSSSPLDLSVKRKHLVSDIHLNSIFSKNLNKTTIISNNTTDRSNPNSKAVNLLFPTNRKSTVINASIRKKVETAQAKNLQKDFKKLQSAYKHIGHVYKTKNSTDILENSNFRENKFRLQISRRNISECSEKQYSSIRKINDNIMKSVLKRKINDSSPDCKISDIDGELMISDKEIELLVEDKTLDQEYEELKEFYNQLSK